MEHCKAPQLVASARHHVPNPSWCPMQGCGLCQSAHLVHLNDPDLPQQPNKQGPDFRQGYVLGEAGAGHLQRSLDLAGVEEDGEYEGVHAWQDDPVVQRLVLQQWRRRANRHWSVGMAATSTIGSRWQGLEPGQQWEGPRDAAVHTQGMLPNIQALCRQRQP
jgi:hypothetical protein